MKKLLLIVVLLMFFVSCFQYDLAYHLQSGLEYYNRARPIDEKLINSVIMEKFAVFKTDSTTYKIILKLNDEVRKEDVEPYKIALESYLDDENIKFRNFNTGNNKQGFNLDVKLERINNNKYIINTIQTNIKAFDSLDIWFYQIVEGTYRDVGSNRITIRNIGL